MADRLGTTRPVRFLQVHYGPLEQREWWRRQLFRRQSANLSVTEFCRQLGVSVTTFYYWKKETEAIRARFANPQPRMFPVAVTFLVPNGLR